MELLFEADHPVHDVDVGLLSHLLQSDMRGFRVDLVPCLFLAIWPKLAKL